MLEIILQTYFKKHTGDPPSPSDALKNLGKVGGEDYWLTASIWSGRFFLLKNSL